MNGVNWMDYLYGVHVTILPIRTKCTNNISYRLQVFLVSPDFQVFLKHQFITTIIIRPHKLYTHLSRGLNWMVLLPYLTILLSSARETNKGQCIYYSSTSTCECYSFAWLCSELLCISSTCRVHRYTWRGWVSLTNYIHCTIHCGSGVAKLGNGGAQAQAPDHLFRVLPFISNAMALKDRYTLIEHSLIKHWSGKDLEKLHRAPLLSNRCTSPPLILFIQKCSWLFIKL